MSRFPRPQFSSYYGPPPSSSRPFIPPNQPQRVPFPYNQGHAVQSQFPDRPQLQHFFPPSHIRPSGQPPNINPIYRQTRPQLGPRNEPRPCYQGRVPKSDIERYYKHSMVESPWKDLEAKMKDSLNQ